MSSAQTEYWTDEDVDQVRHAGVFEYHDDHCWCASEWKGPGSAPNYCIRGGHIWSCCGETDIKSSCLTSTK